MHFLPSRLEVSTRINNRVIIPLLLTITGIMSGCTWVKVSEEEAGIAILPASRVADCQRLGTVSSTVKDRVIGVSRRDTKVETELDNLARKEALKMNANSLVRVSVEDGEGEYIAYRCPE